MIVIGIILLLVAYILPAVGVAVPPPIEHLLSVGGWLLIVIGVVLLILSVLGVRVGGVGPVRNGRRYWY